MVARLEKRLEALESNFKELQQKLLAPKPKQRFLTIDEAAAYIEVSRNTIYRHMKAGLIAFHIIGTKRKVALSDLDEFLSRNHVGALPSIL